ncbi:MAG: hypothetical protein KDC44_16850 [Phaeodactylibacter sp.]|nr:hypothetical protein [Phaeodactylibacter sp.]
MSKKNIGWAFYKDYFSQKDQPGETPAIEEKLTSKEGGFSDKIVDTKKLKGAFDLVEKNKSLEKLELNNYRTTVEALHERFRLTADVWFSVQTNGRGFLSGIGNSHELGLEEEYSLGFHFDHTSGLPMVPGSSLKGALRSAFSRKVLPAMMNFCGFPQVEPADVSLLEAYLFDGQWAGKNLPSAEQMHFIGGAPEFWCGSLLERDTITPHTRGKLPKPTPLPFLKIPAGVTFKFYFSIPKRWKPEVPSSKVLLLFLLCIHRFGLGAKTNYDFGRFGISTESIFFKNGSKS